MRSRYAAPLAPSRWRWSPCWPRGGGDRRRVPRSPHARDRDRDRDRRAGGVGLIVVVGRAAGWNGATWVTWYAEWPGVALAVAGIALATGPAFARDRGAVLFLPVAVLLGTLAIYGVDARVQTDHFWAVRRLVVVLPLLAVFAGVAVAYLWADRRLRAVAVVALAAHRRPGGHRPAAGATVRRVPRLDPAAGGARPPARPRWNTLVITPWLNAPDGRYGVPLRVRFHRTAVPVIHPDSYPLASRVRHQVSQWPGGASWRCSGGSRSCPAA